MNYLQTELILLNLLRQSEEFVVSLLGLMPEPDAGSFYKRLSTLYETFKTDKTGFAASLFRLGQVALFLKEYAALTKQNIDQVDIPEILSPAISWEDIEDKPEFFAPYTHFHKWEEIANKPVKYLPVTHQHTWNDVSDKPTTFPPSAHTHDAQAVAWNDVTDKPTTFPPAEHTHEAQPVAVTWADVTDKPTTFPPAEHTHEALSVAWDAIDDKPTTFAPSEHTHAAQCAQVSWVGNGTIPRNISLPFEIVGGELSSTSTNDRKGRLFVNGKLRSYSGTTYSAEFSVTGNILTCSAPWMNIAGVSFDLLVWRA